MRASFRTKLIFSTLVVWSILASIALAQPKTVTILHTNDIHASFVPHEALWVKEMHKPLIGGFNELAYAVDSLQYVKRWTLLLDAGDVMAGNPITEYEYNGAEGGALYEMMNFVGYDACTVGNHEFDISQDHFRRLINIARFAILDANICDSTGSLFIDNSGFAIYEKNDIKIGIIGLMTAKFHDLVNRKSGAGIIILPPVATLQKWIDQLRPYTDVIIALTHEGIEDDSVLAMNVHGLDVIVGGHSHTQLRNPKIINGVIIVQAGSHCENLGILDLTVENHRVIKYNGELLPLWYNSARGKTPLSFFIDSLKNKIDSDYAEVIGTLKTNWIRNNSGESNIGDFVTDAQREVAGADVAFMNNRGIRKDMLAGPLTKRDLFEILPFRNTLTKFEITGKQIREIVRFEIEKGPAIQTSGIRCEWKRDKKGETEFSLFLINGEPLKDEKVYIGAASDYLMGEAVHYFGFDIPKITYLNISVFSAIEDKVRTMKEISSVVEYRIKRVK
jgi:2',3'-cyclic-nucleotide 2'-phosphodiesterase (5'-nucleotidase family)